MDFAGKSVDLAQSQVMGILNVTPDSFSDGGRFNRLDAALAMAERMVGEGAAFVDVGGESSRPGADPVSEQQELDRVCPVVEAICKRFDVVVSVDTSSPAVIRQAVDLGAGLINDIRALRREGALAAAAGTSVPVCVMHMQGEPDTMQLRPHYDSVTDEVTSFLMQRVSELREAGISPERIIFDPGFGFGKNVTHNLLLLNALDQLGALGYPLLVGLSRKSMLGYITGRDVGERLPASLSVATIAALKGARIIRAHDVRETVDAIRVVNALENTLKSAGQ